MTTIKKQGYITEKKAAELLGRHERWLQNDRSLAKKGNKLKIPYIKQDSRVLYKKADILKFKESLAPATSEKKVPSNPFSHALGFKDKKSVVATPLEAKVEELMRRVRDLEEKQTKGWFARWFA